MSIAVRAAVPGDGPILIAMVRELAVHHGFGASFVARPEDYERFLADPNPLNGALIADWNGEPAGCATWQRAYQTFLGRETLYLEDISVLPAFRRRGIATALLKAVARLAVERRAATVGWMMMGWNSEARGLYEKLGATIHDGNSSCKLSGEALERLAR